MTAPTPESTHPQGPALDATLPWRSLTWLSTVLALLIALDQISRLSGTVLDTAQRAWPYGELMGPSALASRSGWSAKFGDDVTRPVELTVYLLLDLVFIALYAVAAHRVLYRRYRGLTHTLGMVGLFGLVGVDVIEDLLAARTIWVGSLSDDGASALAWVSTVKFGLALVVVGLAGFGLLTPAGGTVRSTLKLGYDVVRHHRLTIVPLLVLAVMALAPGADILDQAPDIERRWSDTSSTFVREGGIGLVVLGVVAVTLFLLGRARSQLAARDADTAPRRRPGAIPLRWWALGPVILLGVAVVHALIGAPVIWFRVVLFCLPAAVILGLSWRLRRRHLSARRAELQLARSEHRAPTPRRPHRPRKIWTHAELERLLRTGDGLAIGVLAVGALGAIRSMTAVVMLWIMGLTPFNGRALTIWILGLVGTLLLWRSVDLVRRILSRSYDDQRASWRRTVARWLAPDPRVGRTPMLHTFPEVLAFGSLVLLVAMGLLPRVFGMGGVLFVFNLGVLGLTGLIAGAGLVAARHAPAEIFVRMHLRSTPVISLVVVAVLFAGEVGSASMIHAVRTAPPSVASPAVTDQRPPLATAIQTWATRQGAAGCAHPVTASGRRVEVLPMVMLGAEGGGIRAAYWTVKSVEQLRTDACAQGSVVFSSGVSGGAVGLAVLRFNREPSVVVEQMSDSRALARGLVGLLVRDFGYATTGVPLPEMSEEQPTAWMDRAALMEQAWNTATPGDGTWRDFRFAQPQPADDEPTGVGSIILNSMSVGNACRVWVSEIQLRSPQESVGTSEDDKIRCDQAGASGLRSIDLLSAYGSPPAGQTAVGLADGCLTGLTASTAAMLAARFPYVTPSGRIGACVRSDGSTAPVDQLVDGGYLENTGLGTINDLADDWLPAVQAWNAAELAKPAPAVPQLIAPMIAYLNNDTGLDQSAPRRDITGEALVPPLARLRAKSDGVADELTLQRSADLVQPGLVCGVINPVCTGALGSLRHRTFMVYPGSQPQIAAPLGWVLSQASRESMNLALADQLEACPPVDDPRAGQICRRGFGSLEDLAASVRTP